MYVTTRHNARASSHHFQAYLGKAVWYLTDIEICRCLGQRSLMRLRQPAQAAFSRGLSPTALQPNLGWTISLSSSAPMPTDLFPYIDSSPEASGKISVSYGIIQINSYNLWDYSLQILDACA